MIDKRLRGYGTKRIELLREIERTKKNRESLNRKLSEVQRLYENNTIDYREYIKLLSQKHEGKTLGQWKTQEKRLRDKYEKPRVGSKFSVAKISLVILVLLSLGLVLSSGGGLQEITGLFFHDKGIIDVSPEEVFQGDILTITITPEISVYTYIYIYDSNDEIVEGIRLCQTTECTEVYEVLYDTSKLEIGNYNASVYDYNIQEWIAKAFSVIEPPIAAGRANEKPYTILKDPLNGSIFIVDKINITLNATVLDFEGDLIDVLIYGVNKTETANFYDYLLYREDDVTSGTNVTYNFTTLPIDPRSEGLVLLMHFDNNSLLENDTYSYDFSGNNNNGTWIGGPFYNTTEGGSKFGYGVEFDGNGDRIVIPNTVSLNPSEITVAAWFKPDSLGWQGIVDKRYQTGFDSYVLRSPANVIEFCIEENTQRCATSSTSLLANNWYHAVGTYDGSNIKMYLNGQLEDVQANPDGIFYSNDDVWIGAENQDGVPKEFNGAVDELAIYNRTLTADEISGLYRLGEDKYYWKVNVTDAVGNNNESEARELFVSELIFGNLSVSLLAPYDNQQLLRNSVFNITANVKCEGAVDAMCGVVSGVGRYNNSLDVPDTPISVVSGSAPFFITYDIQNPWNYAKKIDLGGGDDVARAIAIDSEDNSYTVGDDGAARVIVYKLDSSGSELWTFSYDSGIAGDAVYDVVMDSQEDIITAGYEDSARELLVLKLDSDGNHIWNYTQRLSGGRTAFFHGVVVDSQDNIYAAGYQSDGKSRVIKLDSEGNSIWNYTQDPSAGLDKGGDVAVDSQDNIYIAGDQDDGNVIRVFKLDSDGNNIWNYTQDPSAGLDSGRSIVIDDQDNVYVGGQSAAEMYVFRLDSDGNSIWNTTIGITNTEARDIDLDSNGDVYVAGPAQFGDFVLYTAKLDKNGNLIWQHIDNPSIWNDQANGIAVDGKDNVYVAGFDSFSGQKRVRTIKLSQGAQSNPMSCGELIAGENCVIKWNVNANGNIGKHYKIDVNFSSDVIGVESNDTENATVIIIASGEEVPYTILNEPDNATNFELGVLNITLNATAIDLDEDLIDVLIYGVNKTETANFYNYLLYREDDVTSGTNVTYNFTTLPVDPMSEGLVLLLHFDNRSEFGENDTYSYDFSGNNNNGTWDGGAEYNDTGKFGYAAEFSGNLNDYIEINHSDEFLIDDGTVSLWFNPGRLSDVNGQGQGLLSKDATWTVSGGHFSIWVRGDGRIQTRIQSTGSSYYVNSVPSSINIGEWYNVVVTFGVQGFKLYVDGILVDQDPYIGGMGTSSGGIVGNQEPIALGASTRGSGDYTIHPLLDAYQGLIDEVAIWNRPLNSGEIEDLYRLKSDKYFWKVNVTDTLGNNNESETREFNVGLALPPVVSTIDIRDNDGPAAKDVTPRPANISNVSISVEVIDPKGVCEGSSVTYYLCKPSEYSSCSQLSFSYSGSLTTLDVGSTCTFNNVGLETVDVPWFFDEPGEIGINPWKILVVAEDLGGANSKGENFTYHAITEVGYASLIDLGAPSGGTVSPNAWNTNTVDVYTLTNFGNTPLLVDWNITDPECATPASCGTDKWTIQRDDFMIDDDAQNIGIDPLDTGTLPGVFLNGTEKSFPGIGNPLITCTDETCVNPGSYVGTYYHIKPPTLSLGTYNTIITYTARPFERIPFVILNEPDNATNFELGVLNITLNATAIDLDEDLIDVLIYGVNKTETANFYDYLLYREDGVISGSNVTYNFTSLPVDPLSEGLVMLMHFDNRSEFGENDTYSYDFSGNNNNGTWIGSGKYNTTEEGSKFGYGVEFDGIDDEIRVKDSASLNTGNLFTVAFWFNVNVFQPGIGNVINFLDHDGEHNIEIKADLKVIKIWDGFGGTSMYGTTVLQTGRWYHVAYTYDGAVRTIYLDGQLETQDNNGRVPFPPDTGSDLLIGDAMTIRRDFNGIMDEIAIWNRPLNSGEINDLYRLKSDKYFWKVNVTDTLGNNNESETREFNVL